MAAGDLYAGAKRLDHVNFSPVRKVLEKANELAKSGKKIIHFEIGEPDFDTPKAIVDAAVKALTADKLTHYGPNRGTLALRQAISQKLKIENHYEVSTEDEILITAGAGEAIFDSIMGVINPGDEVIIFIPAFMNYENCINMAGGKCIKLDLREESSYQIDEAAVRKAINEKTKMIIMNNPSNPTGTVYNMKSLKVVAKLAQEFDLIVLSDEIYEKLNYSDTPFCSMASLEGMKERTITVNGFSKVYAMTGWRVGYITADKRFIPPILKIHQYNTTCVATFIQAGLAEGMVTEECKKDVAEMVKVFKSRRNFVMDQVDSINKLSYVAPEAAFYILINVSKTGLDGDQFASRLLMEKGVATVPGAGFGECCRNCIRISYATSLDNLKEGFEKIKEFVNELAV
ncbi:MAG: pyridoxal phosphate-dependent aminotransferase [Clostridiaceae bacterium]|nr:pyridoxal phosphate-dependent aminotransferase [Clostridiaceae bacterium]